MIKYNINYAVKVKLNALGRRVHRRFHDRVFTPGTEMAARFPYKPPKVDEEGYSTFQLWNLMEIFGAEMSLGFETPFDTEILLVDA